MDYNKAIESICYKFGQAVTEFEVFRWLRNCKRSIFRLDTNLNI